MPTIGMPRSRSRSRRLVVVGIAGDKRSAGLDRALARAGQPPALRVSWHEVLSDPSVLRAAGDHGDSLRLESPGSDLDVWCELARRGGSARRPELGEWRPGRAWFRGLQTTLAAIAAETAHLVASHPVHHVLSMTDKLTCDASLRSAGVPLPDALDAEGGVGAFRSSLAARRVHAVFVKPRWGSSGAGVLAYRWSADREQLTSTARLAGDRIWNDKRLATTTDRKVIDRLLAEVLDDGAVVQRWVPKAGVAGGPFDLRVLVVGGRIAQRVARVGRGTITNLHLDATRLDADTALAGFGPAVSQAVDAACQRAAACFPGHLAVGVDVMVDPRGRPFVLECNAWGDYLPGLLSGGLDSYDVQVRALAGEPS